MRGDLRSMRISELFYALQGEGPSIGTPAVFIRLAGCNLQCKWCDTLDVWRRGSDMPVEDVVEAAIHMASLRDSYKEGIYNLVTGRVHIVVTGGEPLLHATDVDELIKDTRARAPSTYFELETNGTIGNDVIYKFDQVNCSPKLESAAEPLIKRIVPEALLKLNKHPNINYKFVVSHKEDWAEIECAYGSFIDLTKNNIYLMPAALTREELVDNSKVVWELAAEKHVKLTTRLQTITWSNLRGK